jgi:hypothetical protein
MNEIRAQKDILMSASSPAHSSSQSSHPLFNMQRGASSLKTLLADFAKSRDLWPLMGALGIGGGMGLFAIYHTAKGMLPRLIELFHVTRSFHTRVSSNSNSSLMSMKILRHLPRALMRIDSSRGINRSGSSQREFSHLGRKGDSLR